MIRMRVIRVRTVRKLLSRAVLLKLWERNVVLLGSILFYRNKKIKINFSQVLHINSYFVQSLATLVMFSFTSCHSSNIHSHFIVHLDEKNMKTFVSASMRHFFR
jgi:hypothetical protein